MNRTKVYLSAGAAAIALSAAAVIAGEPASAQVPLASGQVTQAQLTMAQAVTIAETMGNGRATRARFERDAARPVYKVTVTAPGEAALKLRIAAAGGQIVASERGHD